MTSSQLFLLFFGFPLSILGLGLRRALGLRGVALLLLAALIAAAWGVATEGVLHRMGHGLPLPELAISGLARGPAPFAFGGAILGGLGAVLVRFRGRGAAQ